MDKNTQPPAPKGNTTSRTKKLQQAKKDKLASALRDNLRRRKIPASKD